jgi:sec-independent protein translocase protein TatC
VSDPEHIYPELEGKEEEVHPSSPQEKTMGFFDHIEELRWTLIKCAVVYLIFATLIGFFMKEFNDVLMWPMNHVRLENPKMVIDLGTTTIMESFTVVIEMCFLGALAPAAPFMLYFIGSFIAPALTQKEMKLLTPVCLSSIVLFLMGASFSFFLLVPSTLRVSAQINEMLGFVMRWTPGSYYSLLTWLVLGVGGAFEFPLLIVLLVYIGILKVSTLRHYRRHAIVAIFIIAAIVTPTPDPITQTMFAVPLYLLYEIAVLVGSRIEKRKLNKV